MGEASFAMKLWGATYYMTASMVVQLMNKALFTSYGFHCPLLVGLLQMAIITPVCYAVARPRLEAKMFRSVMPLAVVNVLNLVCGLVGTGGLNVPMFIALRRFTLLTTMLLERVMYKRRHDRSTYGAVSTMILGALLAAVTDLSFNLWGYTAVIGNDFATALYLIMVKNTPAASALTTTGLLFYNAALSVPMLAVAVAASDEPAIMRAYPLVNDKGFQMVLAASAALGLTINHSTFLCTQVNEPLMTSVAGNLKNVLMTVVGAIAFPDFLYSAPNVLGLVLSMIGAVWYATQSAMKAKRRPALLLPQKQPLIGKDRPTLSRAASGGDGSATAMYRRVPSSDAIAAMGGDGGRSDGSGGTVDAMEAGSSAGPANQRGSTPGEQLQRLQAVSAANAG